LRDLPRFHVLVLVVFFVLVIVLIDIVVVFDIVIDVVVEFEARCDARGGKCDCQNHEVDSAGLAFSRFGGGYVVQK